MRLTVASASSIKVFLFFTWCYSMFKLGASIDWSKHLCQRFALCRIQYLPIKETTIFHVKRLCHLKVLIFAAPPEYPWASWLCLWWMFSLPGLSIQANGHFLLGFQSWHTVFIFRSLIEYISIRYWKLEILVYNLTML